MPEDEMAGWHHSPTLTSIHDHWKTIALTRRTFVDKVRALLLNTLSRMVIIFLPRSKRLLISWLQSPSVVILPGPLKPVTNPLSSISLGASSAGGAASIPGREANIPHAAEHRGDTL